MYDETFYKEESDVALQSAEIVLPDLFHLHPEWGAIIDVGCGTGAWAHVAHTLGKAALGVDRGVPEHLRLVTTYIDCDLTNGYPCGGFDLAICLEVAEHLPEPSAAPLVAGLVRARAVLFSAATPGQPGIGHINCQPHDYWHTLFRVHSFNPEYLGPNYQGTAVADFYQRNMYLYTKESQ